VQGGYAEVREGGVYRADIIAQPGSTFRIAVTAGRVTYLKNGQVFYTSLVAPTYPFVLGAILLSAHASLDSVTFGGGTGGGGENTIWSAPVNAIVGQDSLVKLGRCDGCADSGARTVASVASGNAVAQFVFPNRVALATAGLSDAFSVTNRASIDFGIQVQGGFAEVRESGIFRTDIVAEPGATFRIMIASGTVRYAKNGTVFYTSTVAPTYPLTFGAILSSAGASIQLVTFGPGAAAPSAEDGEDSLVAPSAELDATGN
jgi:hypothetical protein